jgi:hypothetical protein
MSRIGKQEMKINWLHDDDVYFKEYNKLNRNKSKYIDQNVLFLTRDPRDVIVSYFHHLKHRLSDNELKNKNIRKIKDISLSELVKNDIGSVKTITEYYNIWLSEGKKLNNFDIISYEEMKLNSLDILKKVLKKFDPSSDIDESVLVKVIEDSEFEKMKKMEKNNSFTDIGFRKIDPGNDNAYKVRKGKVGSYKEEMTEDDIKFIDDYLKNNIDNFYNKYI